MTPQISAPLKTAVGAHCHEQHGTKTIPAFSPTDGEVSRSLLSRLLTFRRHSATRKHLFLFPQGDRSGQRKPKNNKHQHKSEPPPAFISLSQSQLI